jgi:hypothetical protein
MVFFFFSLAGCFKSGLERIVVVLFLVFWGLCFWTALV